MTTQHHEVFTSIDINLKLLITVRNKASQLFGQNQTVSISTIKKTGRFVLLACFENKHPLPPAHLIIRTLLPKYPWAQDTGLYTSSVAMEICSVSSPELAFCCVLHRFLCEGRIPHCEVNLDWNLQLSTFSRTISSVQASICHILISVQGICRNSPIVSVWFSVSQGAPSGDFLLAPACPIERR